jgi:aryl-alcohol dehydrogenase-like predicted oxidoreductase
MLRRLGNSELKITPVVIGTWALGGWLWGGTEHNDATGAITTAIGGGINTIDTAPVYGFGLSEELVGQAIKGRRDGVIIATKCGLVWDDRPGGTPFFDTADNSGKPLTVRRNLRKESILAECDASLQRLGIDVIDLYQCHWPDPDTPIDYTIEALLTLREQGKIRAFGVSNFSVEQLQEILTKGVSPASNQPKYSLLSREIEADVLPFCCEHEIGSLAYSPMEMGLLTGKIGINHTFPDNDTRNNRPWFQPENRAKALAALEQIRPIAEKLEINLAQLATAWVHHQPGMTAAIVGCRNAEQARANAAAARVVIPAEDLQAIRTIFEPLQLAEPFDPATARR